MDADRLIEATQSALKQDGDLLDEQARAAIEQQMKQLKALTRDGSPAQEARAVAADAADGEQQDGRAEEYRAALKDETDKLARLTDPFAALRMDRAIQRALSGKTISELSADSDAARGTENPARAGR